jgi:hypothetical protein
VGAKRPGEIGCEGATGDRPPGDADIARGATEEFLANLSHDLRAPLNAVLLWVRLLRSGALDAAATQRALEGIEENLATLNKLISDLSDGQYRPPTRPSPEGPPEPS